MPIGPNGEKRPSDPIACAVHVMRIATREIEETYATAEELKHEQARKTTPAPVTAFDSKSE